MIGTEIGNYRIIEKLGEGGMGVVYKAVDTSLDRVVAVKVLNGDLARVPELVARFRGEAKAQANLNHTNLATLYAFITTSENAMMVMEFVDGETFSQMIHRRGPLPAQGAVPMFRQALLGFGYAHRAGIIHRDIKPSNIMLNRQGIVKVMDFGIAKAIGERGLTRTGMQVGTCRYMSPEQVLNKNADIRSDIYSLGITLYEMLTGNAPFQSDSEFQVMSDHVHTPPPPPSKFYPYIPKGVENAILKALAKNPDERFQTVEEFGAALERPDDFGLVPGAVVAAPGAPPPPLPPTTKYDVPAQGAWPATATMAAPGVAGVPPPPPQAPFAASFQSPTVAQTMPPQFPGGPPYQPPPVGPKPAPNPLFGTWPGRILLLALVLLVMLMGGYFTFKSLFQPPPPKPLSAAAVPQVAPSQVVNPTPNQERVDIEMNNTPAAAGLQVQTFEATPNPVRPGQRVTLSWAVAGASAVVISPAIGTVPAQGSREFNARSDVQFVLVAKAADGQTVSKTLDVQVDRGGTNRPKQETSSAPPQQPPQSVQTPPSQQQETQTPPPDTQTAQAPPPPVPQKQVRASPVMNLFHDHGPGVPWPRCWGQLQIGGGRVVYHVLGASDGRRDDFVAPVSAITDVRVNMIPIRGHPAFHMRVNGQVFNFIPAAGAPVVYVNVISQWLQAR
jgi:serine/threonine-protein kinase